MTNLDFSSALESTPPPGRIDTTPPWGIRSLAIKSSFVPKKSWISHSQQALDLALKFSKATQGGIAILSSEGELLEHLVRGQPTERSGERERASWFLSLMRRVAQHQGPIRTSTAEWSDAGIDLDSPTPRVGPLLAVPFYCPSRCRGVLYLVRSEGENWFNTEEEETAQSLATWIEQGNLIDETRLLAQLQLLNTVAQAAAGNLDLAQILAVSLRELDRHLPLHVSAIWLVEDRDRPVGEKDAVPSTASEVCLKLADLSPSSVDRTRHLGLPIGSCLEIKSSPFAVCLSDGQPLFADRTPSQANRSGSLDSAERALYLMEASATSCFAVPLRAGDRTVGILHSVCTRPSGFIVEQIQLLYLVADLIGPAISNCQLFARLSGAYEDLRVTQGQLIQAEKMRALGELASGMAHEFNNSLCGVLGFLELALLNRNLEASTRANLESGRVCALDAAQVVRRVQDFSRKHSQGTGSQAIEFNQLINQTVGLIRHKWESLDRARSGPVEVGVETGPEVTITGDPAEIREVITNLVFNAVDAMPEGGKVTIRSSIDAKHVILTVTDTGIGMPEAVRQRLFEPFFTTKGDRGNGLGLSVVFGIVQRHGGDIHVESELGKGTTFRVRLPRGASDAKAPITSATSPVEERRGEFSLRILVVEDEESIRRFLKSGLTSLGHRPLVTADAEEGLAAFAADEFDLVLTDLGLPGISGEEVARVVSKKAPGVPVVLLTGWADQLNAENHFLEGVTRILSKPVTLDTLNATLRLVSSPAGASS